MNKKAAPKNFEQPRYLSLILIFIINPDVPGKSLKLDYNGNYYLRYP